MKTLLKAIPSKTIVVHGAEYQVYDIINYTGKSINVYLHGLNHQRKIKHFDEIVDEAERLKVFYYHINDLVQLANDLVEEHYLGDRLRYADEDTRVSVSLDKKGFLRAIYSFNCPFEFKSKTVPIHIGKESKVTKAEIQEIAVKAGNVRLAKNMEYNIRLAEKHRLFRKLVEQQIAWRSTIV